MELLTEARECQAFWAPRTKKIKEWYKLARLIDVLASPENKDLETVVSNRPRAFRNLALHLLSSSDVIDSIPISDEDRKERDRKSDAERALTSIHREKDIEQIEAGEMVWRRQFADFAFMTGYYAVLHGIYKKKDGSPHFRKDILNSGNSFQRWVNRKLVGFYYIYSMSSADASYLAKYKEWDWQDKSKGDKKSNVKVYQCYYLDGDKVLYGVYLDDAEVIAPKILKGLEKIPILTAPVGGFADRGTDNDIKDYIERIGESLLEPIAGVQLRRNKLRSCLQQIVKRLANQTIIDYTRDKQGFVSPGQDQGAILHAEIGEDARPLALDVRALPEISVLLGQDDTEEQLATIPVAAYGTTLGLELSGYAYAQMMTAALSCLGEINIAQNLVRGVIGKTWLDGYKKNWPANYKIGISGPERGHTGFFSKDFHPKDVPNLTYVEVKSELAMPSNMIQRIAAARQAIPEGDLMDFITVASDLLQLPDPELVRTRIHEHDMERSIQMQQVSLLYELDKAYQYYKDKDPEKAKRIEWAIKQTEAQFGFEPGKGTPRRAGISPENAPPETTGIPPAMLRQLYGGNVPREIGASRFGGR